MRSQDSNERPAMTWVPVRDAEGRTRMECRWGTPSHLHAAKPHAA